MQSEITSKNHFLGRRAIVVGAGMGDEVMSAEIHPTRPPR